MDMKGNLVADYLEQMAPSQTHELRHEFQEAARVLRGIDLANGDAGFNIAVRYDDKLLGYVRLLVTTHASGMGGDPNVYASFDRIEYEPEADSES